ncbi:MAG TPA: bacillithiol biosynthesis BshC, partial [Gemmatimonadaceae bacterium]|nr:bacillithiol biosynthesis BshC [Gemmatimonadaceae bacterium]
VLRRLGLQPDDLRVPHVAERRLSREAMNPQTAAGLAALRADVAALAERLGSEPRELGLDAAVQGAIGSLQHRVDRLERRLLAGVARRESERMRDLGTARGALYPFGGRQERTLNLVPILARHGVALLEELHAAAAGYADEIVAGVATRVPATPVA